MNFSDLGGQKFAFMAGLTLLDFSFGEVWHFVKAKIWQKSKFWVCKIVKIAIFAMIDFT